MDCSLSLYTAARCSDLCDVDDGVVERDMRVVQIASSGVGMMVMTVGCPKSGR